MKHLPFVLLMVSVPAFAQDSAQYHACNEKSKTQKEMNACANEEAARVDAELNDVYQRLLVQAKGQDAAIARIKTAEVAWTAYRDAYMDAMYPAKDKQAEYGSIYPAEADILRARLTKVHIEALRDLMRHYER